jgi:hypothetical protein
MIVRDIPESIRSGAARFVPLFALYAKPQGGGPTLLDEMIARSGLAPETFVHERLVRPFVRQWFELAVERGITSEPHAQNVLVEIGQDSLPTGRFLHRDLAGFNVDFDYRQRIRLAPRVALPVVTQLADDYHLRHSDETLKNLSTYFGGGFVFNLDQELAQNRSLRRVGPAFLPRFLKRRPPTPTTMFEAEIQRQLSERNQRSVTTGTPQQLVDATESARALFAQLTRKAGGPGIVDALTGKAPRYSPAPAR